jgi:hypothetical protein
MKTALFIALAILLKSFPSLAQEKNKGFYINPNLNFSRNSHYYGGGFGTISPQIAVGYLWDHKNRQNVSLTFLNGGIRKHSQQAGIGLRYSYDIALYRSKKLKLYISPYIKLNAQMYNSKNPVGSPFYHHRQKQISVQSGISPQIEYKIGKKVDLIVSAPLNFLTYHFTNSLSNDGTARRKNSNSQFNFRPSVDANIGLRINLFNKK